MIKIVVKNTKDCVKDAIKKQIISNKDELLKDLETMDKNTVVVKVFDSIRYYNLPTKTRNALEMANIEITPEVLKEKGKEERVTAFSESMMTYAEDLLEQIKIDDETKKLYNKKMLLVSLKHSSNQTLIMKKKAQHSKNLFTFIIHIKVVENLL